jgi:hypothetical protein
MRVFLGPIGGEANGLAGGHLDEGEGLAASDEEGVVGGTAHLEGAPETDALHIVEAGVDRELIAQDGGALVVDLRAQHDGEDLGQRHLTQLEAEKGRQPGAGGFDHAQVGEVVHHAAAVGVEKHDFFAGGDGGGVGHRWQWFAMVCGSLQWFEWAPKFRNVP